MSFEKTPIGLTARGAAIYSHRLANNQPTYLDTLPRIKMIVTCKGEPVWIDLIKEDDNYVEGSNKFHREKIGAELMTIPSNRKSLTIELNHEEYPTVREIKSRFDIKTEKTVSVSLSASIMPAQGNAQIEVVPDHKNTLGRKRIYACWKTMQKTDKTPEQWLTSLPRAYPPVTTRKSGTEPWQKVSNLIKKVMNKRKWDLNQLKKIRLALQKGYSGEYPVSSDCVVSINQDLLEEFIEYIVGTLQSESSTSWFYGEGWRVLAHSFAKHYFIENMLGKEINRFKDVLPVEPLLAVGRCIRTAKYAAKFVEILLKRLDQSHTGLNNWLRAFSEIVKYRSNTFEIVSSDICEKIWKHLIPIFKHELRPGDASRRRILPYSFVGLAFLLRRRVFEPDFLSPNSSLAKEAKSVACYAQEMARSGKLVFAENSSIKMELELQRFIDYVDRKGHGSIAMAELD